MLVRRARDQDAAWFADAFQPSRDVDPLAENVVAFDEHVAEMDADAIDDAFAVRFFRVALNHQPLNCDRALHGGDD